MRKAEEELINALKRLKQAGDERVGVTIVKDAFTEDALLAASAEAKRAYEVDVKPQLPSQEWPTGIIGNKNFGYLIAQPEEKSEVPRLTLSSDMTFAVAMGSAYRANIALMAHPSSSKARELLLRNGARRVVSQDFCKLYRGDLTPPHVDLYSQDEGRIQAMGIGLNEGSVRLCYLAFSNVPEVRALITRVIGHDLYAKNKGYQAVRPNKAEELVECFRRADCILYGSPRDLVIWESGVIHLEMQLKRDGSLVIRNDKTTTTERFIVGVHELKEGHFSDRDLIEISYAADHGFIFHPYGNFNAEGTPAALNSFHKKRTQYLKPRQRSNDEKARFAQVQEAITQKAPVDEWLSNLSPEKKLCFGIKE